jgi:hypothetical protein
MVPSQRACGFAAGSALFPVIGWAYHEQFLHATFGSDLDKVMARGTPANPARLVTLKG